jgi:N-acetylneuraminic acid mutarotase
MGTVMIPLLEHPVPFFSRRSMALCAVDRRLIFFGGVGAASTESILDVANDCWLFNPDSLTWSELEQNGLWPSPRRCVGVTSVDSGMYLWGGSGITGSSEGLRYDFLNDWWHLNIATRAWTLLRPTDDHRISPLAGAADAYPCPRYTPVFQSAAGLLFLFGGYTEDRLGKRKLNDAWIFDGSAWREVERTGHAGYGDNASWPGLRYGCMSASDGERVYVFGGYSDDGDHNDMWYFDIAANRWGLIAPESTISGAPAARYCAAFVYYKEKLYLFGGRSRRYAKLNFNDVWMFDLATFTWACLSDNRTPHAYDANANFPAYHAKSSSAALSGYWYIWGGEGVHGHVSDFWRFEFDSGTWRMLQAARRDDPRFW